MVLVPPLRAKEEEKASTVAACRQGRPKDSSEGSVIRIENQTRSLPTLELKDRDGELPIGFAGMQATMPRLAGGGCIRVTMLQPAARAGKNVGERSS